MNNKRKKDWKILNMYFENEIWDQYVDKNSKIGSR